MLYRRFLALMLAVLLVMPAYADSAAIKNISIDVTLLKDGSAVIRELWDVNVVSGTEWYLTRNNLGDIDILNLSVTDESGLDYIVEHSWDVNRTMAQKTGRCGLNSTSYGCEICWGVGSYGRHKFSVSYTMTNVVKSLDDYDMLHMQFVSPGLSSCPEHASVRIRIEEESMDDTGERIWGFGYYGDINFQKDGTVLAETSKPIPSNGSIIVLMRFDKGIFNSQSIQARSFDDVLQRAMAGADFEEQNRENEGLLDFILPIIIALMAVSSPVWLRKLQRRSILGKEKDITWCRDVPFGGDLAAADYVLQKLGEHRKSNSLASALILRMIYEGQLKVNKDADDKIEISFNDDGAEKLDGIARDLYDMMKDASGSDRILQEKEFSRWSRRNGSRLEEWGTHISAEGFSRLHSLDAVKGQMNFTANGKAKAREMMGFKKYLNDYTLVAERETAEVVLWRDYLVFASLFGIAEKVAKQLSDINPQLFRETMVYDYPTTRTILWQTRHLSNSITNAQQREAASKASRASGGFGGGASFGGGGGFSGGGFGGGSR